MKKYFLGIDVSKKELAYCLSKGPEGIVSTGSVDNNSKDISSFLKKTLKSNAIPKEQLLVCAEFTGVYSNILAWTCVEEGITLWLEHPSRMKSGFKDLGRGKDDMMDAKRIAEYSWRYLDKMVEYKPKSPSILKLKTLLGLKKNLMKSLHTFSVRLGEDSRFIVQECYLLEKEILDPAVEALAKAIEDLEDQIANVIEADVVLANQDRRIQSIPGVGPAISHNMICLTEGFTKFKDAHSFQSYCGMVPVKYESGTSVRKKTSTSNVCSHVMKPIMYMPCIRFVSGSKSPEGDTELHDYYIRKTEDEGKHHNSVTNVLMAKLVARMFAVVRDDRDYLPEMKYDEKYHPERITKEEAATS